MSVLFGAYSPSLPFLFLSYNPLPLTPQHFLGCPCFGGAAKCLDRPSVLSVAGCDTYAPFSQLFLAGLDLGELEPCGLKERYEEIRRLRDDHALRFPSFVPG